VTTLLTGATGYLGGYALHGLLERGERVVALVRAKDEAEARARLWQALDLHLPRDAGAAATWLAERLATGRLAVALGDVRAPGLGLDARARARVDAEVTGVLHVAASLNRRSERVCMDVNLRGGLEVVLLARALHERGRLRRYTHVSTVAVAGKRSREVVREDDAARWDLSDWDPYARTKKLAEHLGTRLLDGASVVIARPSIVLGDSRFPATTQFDMVRAFVRLAQSPVLPFDPRARLDIVPADFVADALVRLHLSPRPRHRLYHLSAGEQAPTFRELTDAMARARGGRAPVYLPRLGGPCATAIAALSRGRHPLSRLAALLDVFWPYLTWDVVFDNRRAVEETGRAPARFPDYCAGLFRFALDRGFAYPHRPAPAAVVEAPRLVGAGA
jgi:thioester reductase-like protein